MLPLYSRRVNVLQAGTRKPYIDSIILLEQSKKRKIKQKVYRIAIPSDGLFNFNFQWAISMNLGILSNSSIPVNYINLDIIQQIYINSIMDRHIIQFPQKNQMQQQGQPQYYQKAANVSPTPNQIDNRYNQNQYSNPKGYIEMLEDSFPPSNHFENNNRPSIQDANSFDNTIKPFVHDFTVQDLKVAKDQIKEIIEQSTSLQNTMQIAMEQVNKKKSTFPDAHAIEDMFKIYTKRLEQLKSQLKTYLVRLEANKLSDETRCDSTQNKLVFQMYVDISLAFRKNTQVYNVLRNQIIKDLIRLDNTQKPDDTFSQKVQEALQEIVK